MSPLLIVCAVLSAVAADESLRFIDVFVQYLNNLDSTPLQFQHDFGGVAPPYLSGQREVYFWKPFSLQPGSTVTHPDNHTTLINLNIKMDEQIGIWPRDKSSQTYLWGCRFQVEYKITRSSNKRVEMEPSSLTTNCNKVQYQDGTHPTTDIPYLQRDQILKAFSKVLLEKIELYFSFFGDEDELVPSLAELQRILRMSMMNTSVVY